MQYSREQARLGLQRLCRGLLVNMMALGMLVPVLDIISATQATATEEISKPDADILIVGAGIAGLSAALELARGGTSVAVIDAFSVFGGHAVVSNGAVSMVDTPLQRSLKINVSLDIHFSY